MNVPPPDITFSVTGGAVTLNTSPVVTCCACPEAVNTSCAAPALWVCPPSVNVIRFVCGNAAPATESTVAEY